MTKRKTNFPMLITLLSGGMTDMRQNRIFLMKSTKNKKKNKLTLASDIGNVFAISLLCGVMTEKRHNRAFQMKSPNDKKKDKLTQVDDIAL